MDDVSTFQPFKGKVALITGGTRGIGAGISRKFAEWGADLCIGYIDRDTPAKEIAEELRSKGTRVTLYRADLGEPSAIKDMMRSIEKDYGRLDILIHNAGATKFVHFLEADIEQWRFIMDTNARATWLLAQAALPLMKDRPGARFITLTNSMGLKVSPGAGLFAAAKASLEIVTQYLSWELAPHGIVVNCVRPGRVKTGVFKIRPDFQKRVEQERMVTPWEDKDGTTPEKSANAIALLCLPEASWIAGETLTVDGGYRWWGRGAVTMP